jgi:hypothetical protein
VRNENVEMKSSVVYSRLVVTEEIMSRLEDKPEEIVEYAALSTRKRKTDAEDRVRRVLAVTMCHRMRLLSFSSFHYLGHR